MVKLPGAAWMLLASGLALWALTRGPAAGGSSTPMIVMLTVAMWVKHDLNEKYANVVLIPAVLLWITVTCGIIWYEIVVVPDFFKAGVPAKADVRPSPASPRTASSSARSR